MNYLLAKVKRKEHPLKVLSTKEDIYFTPVELENAIVYNPATLLEDNQWYKIESFKETAYAVDFIKSKFISVNHDQLTSIDFLKINYLCAIQNEKYFFQNISSSHLIKKNWFSIGKTPTLKKDQPIIIVNNIADAIYDNTNNILYFQKLSIANGIFKGIDMLYRTATDKETKEFLNNEFLRPADDFTFESVKIPNRKRIALVTDTLKKFTPEEKKDIFSYINDYCKKIPFKDGAFDIQSDDDLKNIIYGIEQRFYTTRHGNEKRIANSIITLEV